ncbi:EF hand [Polaromonas sp. YR568]|uniref:acid-shock protein n=1 Tax=Polaromonas sp. YR568 TaxID=1855301 RepID=UPI0008DF44E4|nr:acid-shock protein [Polaromonas sp. YR568]SFU72971.1 EF hand [Polaromonas sp. YR568]
MTLHTTATQHSKHSIPSFELRSVLLVAALAVGAAGAVRAQTAPPSPASPTSPPSKVAPAAASGNAGAVPQNRATTQDVEAAFNRADVNRDGKLDRQEAEHFPAVAQRFEQIDTNHDTFISLAELAKAAGGS